MNDDVISTNRLALQATIHCLTGCSIGEILGLVIATALNWHDVPSILLSIALAFVFGYGLTVRPLLAAGLPVRRAAMLALASDTVSIATMEAVDSATVILIPGALAAGLLDGLFWGSLGLSLVLAGVVAWPVNRWLIGRARGTHSSTERIRRAPGRQAQPRPSGSELGWPTGFEPVTFGATIRCSAD
jgi:hypothetical protein